MTSSTELPTILRGDDAARAVVVDLLAGGLMASDPTGLWAEETDRFFDEAREQGYRSGFDRGVDEGRTDGFDQSRSVCASAIGALDALIENLEQSNRRLGEEIGDEVASLALAATQAILDREIAATTDPGREAIIRCLSVAPEVGSLIARLHPEDIKQLGHLEVDLGERPITIVPDASLRRGDAIVTVGDTTIDGRLGSALDRLREALA